MRTMLWFTIGVFLFAQVTFFVAAELGKTAVKHIGQHHTETQNVINRQ